jgi:hypothetical protein
MMPAVVSPDDVAEAPELLVLASLDATLMALRVAVYAAFPELSRERGLERDPPLLTAARRLADRASMLDDAVRRYREELDYARPPDPIDDLPF